MITQFVGTIEETFVSDPDLDGLGESHIVPSVVIITMLVEQLRATPPKPAQIAAWKANYLAIYDEQIEELAPKGAFKQKRRKVIETTFLKLEELAKEFWPEA